MLLIYEEKVAWVLCVSSELVNSNFVPFGDYDDKVLNLLGTNPCGIGHRNLVLCQLKFFIRSKLLASYAL